MVLKFVLEDELEQRFRETAMRRHGYMKGALQKAMKQALNNYVMQQSTKIPKVKDPFKLVRGILSHLKGKKTSVELQHEAINLWTKSS